MTPFFKVKITLGPFANGQTRVIEYKTLLPMMTGTNRQRLVEKFAQLFEEVESIIDENLGAAAPSTGSGTIVPPVTPEPAPARAARRRKPRARPRARRR